MKCPWNSITKVIIYVKMDVRSFFPFPNCEIFFLFPPLRGGRIGKNILPWRNRLRLHTVERSSRMTAPRIQGRLLLSRWFGLSRSLNWVDQLRWCVGRRPWGGCTNWWRDTLSHWVFKAQNRLKCRQYCIWWGGLKIQNIWSIKMGFGIGCQL